MHLTENQNWFPHLTEKVPCSCCNSVKGWFASALLFMLSHHTFDIWNNEQQQQQQVQRPLLISIISFIWSDTWCDRHGTLQLAAAAYAVVLHRNHQHRATSRTYVNLKSTSRNWPHHHRNKRRRMSHSFPTTSPISNRTVCFHRLFDASAS